MNTNIPSDRSKLSQQDLNELCGTPHYAQGVVHNLLLVTGVSVQELTGHVMRLKNSHGTLEAIRAVLK
jgi:hypothetical protein